MVALKYIHDAVEALKEWNQRAVTGEAALILIAAMCLVHKSLDEFTCRFGRTEVWAKISGLGMEVMEATERDMLEALDYKLYTTPAKYSEWLDYLVEFTDRHMPEHRFVPVECQTLAEISPIESLYSTTTLGYVPLVLETHAGDLIDFASSSALYDQESVPRFQAGFCGTSLDASQGQDQGTSCRNRPNRWYLGTSHVTVNKNESWSDSRGFKVLIVLSQQNPS
ncbi:hypothetical protein BGZ96_003824 [Linnemannia gamsii]|uniref:Cyclin N-terminal domain-containing protein n=1 Tax=Linnemannia gamsii TaxID=64522 RepID=A0ABQ7JIV8_9FUNG|nr:hypothetical protein BGZ96_003824 [Linnemannia gamsii]